MIKFLQSLYLTNRFFQLFAIIIAWFLLSFPFDFLYPTALAALTIAGLLIFIDLLRIYAPAVGVVANRQLPKVFSLSDPNKVIIELVNQASIPLNIRVIDELPPQLQIRDFEQRFVLPPTEKRSLNYNLRPVERGVYQFGTINFFLSTNWNLVERRIRVAAAAEVPVYPSIVQMKQLEMRAFDRITHHQGIKKMRRIGQSYEFDHIKSYVRGDDYRSINWKASSRRGDLMVNKYEDERSQQIYSIIDKSRNMKMPFHDLSLVDYAINAALAFSNIVLKKYDRAGLISFSDKIGTVLKADSRSGQLNKILSALYKEKDRTEEANFELLYYATRKLISGRSLIMLYTNFESMYALDRVLPILRKINAIHLLVVVIFENTEIKDFISEKAQDVEDVYKKTIAKRYVLEKEAMANKLQQFGIQTVLTHPTDLSMNTINKYLEIKARGLI